MVTLPDISRSLYSTQIRSLQPPITIRSSQRGCIIQVNCPEYMDDELSYSLKADRIQLIGTPMRRERDSRSPFRFDHRIRLGFDASEAKTKSVYLNGVFSIFIQK